MQQTKTDQGLAYLDQARAMFDQAKLTYTSDRVGSEKQDRESLRVFRRSMDWLEDTEYFETAHHALDAAGNWVKLSFDCFLESSEGRYFQTCPVSLAHSRVGLSIGGIIQKAVCSICGKDAVKCAHITGHEYIGQRCYVTITQVDLVEVSIVSRPEQPDAHIE